MSFTIWCLLIYIFLFCMDVVAYKKGKESKIWSPFIAITAIMIIGIALLGYLWITSPM